MSYSLCVSLSDCCARTTQLTLQDSLNPRETTLRHFCLQWRLDRFACVWMLQWPLHRGLLMQIRASAESWTDEDVLVYISITDSSFCEYFWWKWLDCHVNALFWGVAHSSLFFYIMVLLNDAEHPSFSQNKRAIRWKQRIFLSSLWMWEWQPVQAGPATELRQAPASHCSSMQLKQMQFFYLSVLCGNNWAISNLLVQWVSRPADRLFVLYFTLNSFDFFSHAFAHSSVLCKYSLITATSFTFWYFYSGGN